MEYRGGTDRSGAAFFVLLAGLVAIGAMVGAELGLSQTLAWNAAWTAARSARSGRCSSRARARCRRTGQADAMGAAAACWLAGQIAWDMFTVTDAASPNIADAGYWAFALLVIAACCVRSRDHGRCLRSQPSRRCVDRVAMALIFAELWGGRERPRSARGSRSRGARLPGGVRVGRGADLQAMVGGSLGAARRRR